MHSRSRRRERGPLNLNKLWLKNFLNQEEMNFHVWKHTGSKWTHTQNIMQLKYSKS